MYHLRCMSTEPCVSNHSLHIDHRSRAPVYGYQTSLIIQQWQYSVPCSSDQNLIASSSPALLSSQGCCLSTCRIKSSCAWLLGVTVALKGNGWLMTPGVKLTSGSISLPVSSKPFLISKVARDRATVSHTDESASCFPGQIRRPKPKTKSYGSGAGLGPRNRDGSNTSGCGYTAGSCVNHLSSTIVVVST